MRYTVLALCVLALAACSSDSNQLLDANVKSDIAEEKSIDVFIETSVDVRVDTLSSDVRLDAVPDVVLDVASEVGVDVAMDLPRDVVPDVRPDVVVCSAPRMMCGTSCVDVTTDVRNCGRCNQDCVAISNTDPAGASCAASTCTVRCLPGRANCDGDLANGCETDITTGTHCGSCTRSCSGATPLCAAGMCSSGCGAVTPDRCGATCVDLQRDVRNCGSCATACSPVASAVETCVSGRCGFQCNVGFHLCAGACVSDTSTAACGAACIVCASRPNTVATCAMGGCRYACVSGFGDCDGDVTNGCERPVSSDVSNCGGCGTVCAGTDTECRRRTCVSSACGFVNTPTATRISVQVARDCRTAVCDGTGGVTTQADNTDLPVDGNECTADVCAGGVASNPPAMVGLVCMASRQCDGRGACVECLRGSDCTSGICMMNVCVSASCSDGIRNGAETGIDCGGTCPVCQTLALLAGSTASILAASSDATSPWTTTTLAGSSVEAVSVAVTSTGDAIGLMRFTTLGSPMDNRLRFTWRRGGTWSAFSDIGSAITTRDSPVVVQAPGGGVWAMFHGFDFNHYFAVWNVAGWTPAAETTGSSGARAADIVRDGTNPLMVFSNGLGNELYSRTKTTSWGGDQRVETAAGFDFMVQPTVANLSATSQLVTWVRGDSQVRFSVRASGVWSAGADVSMALARGRVALARISDTQAILAFKGTDNNLYAAVFTAPSWGAPVRVAMGITGVPSVAHGVGAALAELAYLDATGRVMHTRLSGSVWSTATSVAPGSGYVTVSITSGP
jgi:hypothetical protein